MEKNQHLRNNMERSSKKLFWALMQISRFNQYNGLLATFAGVWATLLAGAQKLQQEPGMISVSLVFEKAFLCFAFCYIFCGAGMVWNDWIDCNIDAHVARTKNRPLPAGTISSSEALLWMLVQFMVSVGIIFWMSDGYHMWSSILPITIGTLLYPFGKKPIAKKLGVYPQYILGVTLAWPAIPGWASIYGEQQTGSELISNCLPLLLFTFMWTIYFNTAYSFQDIKDDCKLNVNSSYVWAGQYIHAFLVVLGTFTLMTIPWILLPLDSTWLWLSWMGVWSASFIMQMLSFETKKPETGGTVHRWNFALGNWTVLVCVLEVLLHA